jgi:hypothetical protein
MAAASGLFPNWLLAGFPRLCPALYADTLLTRFLSAFGFLFSLLPFCSFDMAILLVESAKTCPRVSSFLGCALTGAESSGISDTIADWILHGPRHQDPAIAPWPAGLAFAIAKTRTSNASIVPAYFVEGFGGGSKANGDTTKAARAIESIAASNEGVAVLEAMAQMTPSRRRFVVTLARALRAME